MSVTAEQSGQYVQISRKLRIQRGPGVADLVSERPSDPRTKRLLDDPANAPTLITLTEGDLADVPSLLALGAIVPYAPPKSAKKGGA